MRRNTRAADSMFLKLRWIGACDQRHHDTAFLYHTVRMRECFFAHRIEHGVDIFRDILKPSLAVIHRHVSAQLLEKILVCRRGSRDHARASRFCNLHRKTTDAAGTTVDKNCLPWLKFCDLY